MTSEAQRAANRRQDATRKRVAIWLDPKTIRLVDRLRGDAPRAAYVRALLARVSRTKL